MPILKRLLPADDVFKDDGYGMSPERLAKTAFGSSCRIAGYLSISVSFVAALSLLVWIVPFTKNDLGVKLLFFWIVLGVPLYQHILARVWERAKREIQALSNGEEITRQIQFYDQSQQISRREAMLNTIVFALLGLSAYVMLELLWLSSWLPSPLREIIMALLSVALFFWFFLYIPIKDWLKWMLGDG